MFIAIAAAAAVIAGSIPASASTVLSIQLIQRCPPAADCSAPHTLARMRRETEQIWRSLDVRIEWVDSRPAFDASPRRLTVFLESEGAPAPQHEAVVLASLHPPAEPCEGGVVQIWMRNVRQQLASLHVAGVPFVSLPNALGDVILARALGRALAHEIGHYLLGTGAHAQRGLMRARFAPLEFGEELSAQYGLEPRERGWLALCRAEATQSGEGMH